MSKRKIPRQKKRRAVQRATRRKYIGIAALGLMLTLCLGTVMGPWRNSSGAKRLKALFGAPVAPPSIPPSNNPSKEYIYAGSKLIATAEAPVPLLPPASLVATTLSNQLPAPVSITWAQVEGADHYEVERTTNIGGNYTPVNSNVTSTTFTDTSVSSVTAYLYRVRAVDGVGNVSPYSSIDVATAITFTDDTIESLSTTVKRAHITELRQAVDAVRITANLSPANWGDAITVRSVSTILRQLDDRI